MIRFWFPLVFFCIVCPSGVSADEHSVVQIDYTPPSDAIQASSVQLIGARDIQIVKLHDPIEFKKEHTLMIPLKNEDDEPKTITGIILSCGCMSAILKDKSIPSGQQVTLFLSLKLDSTGESRKRIGIRTDDGQETVVFIDARVKHRFEVTPSHVFFEEGSDRKTRIIVSSNFKDAHFEAKLLDPETKLTSIERREFDPLSREYEIEKTFSNSPNRHSIWQVPVVINTPEKSYEYELVCHDRDGIRIIPEKPVAFRYSGLNDQTADDLWSCQVMIHDESGKDREFLFEIPDSELGLTVNQVDGKWRRDSIWLGVVVFKGKAPLESQPVLLRITESASNRKLAEREVQFRDRLQSFGIQSASK
jgi:hypothetical protein